MLSPGDVRCFCGTIRRVFDRQCASLSLIVIFRLCLLYSVFKYMPFCAKKNVIQIGADLSSGLPSGQSISQPFSQPTSQPSCQPTSAGAATASQPTSSRRLFLKNSATQALNLGKLSMSAALITTAAETLAPRLAHAAVTTNDVPQAKLDPVASRRLHLVNVHTREELDIVYFTHGMYIDENMAQLNHLMRDRRANVATAIDTNLYDQLLRLQIALGITDPVHVLSGYRTPETNAKLRRRSSGVAKFSLHMEGRAADIYIPGIPVKKLRNAALSLQAGGVGLYSRSNFIHLDTGAVRHWGN